MNIVVSIVIKRPVADVFAFTDDIENEVIWRPELTSSEKTSDGPIGVGTTGRSVYKILGRPATSEWVITEYEPNRKVVFQSDGANGPHRGVWLYEPIDVDTKFTWIVENENEMHGIFRRLRENVQTRLSTRVFQSDLENLKRLLEA